MAINGGKVLFTSSSKRPECPLWVADEILPQVGEFKYLWVLFTSEDRMEREIDSLVRAVSVCHGEEGAGPKDLPNE